MRTDVKLGFVIGGILLAVVIVYGVVVGRGGSTVSEETATLTMPAEVPVDATAVTPPPVPIPDEPVAIAPPVTTVTPTVPEVAPPETTSVEPAAPVVGASSRWDWNKMLNDGSVVPEPMMSTATIDPGASTTNAGSMPTAPLTVAYTAPTTPSVSTPSITDPIASASMTAGRTHTVKKGETLSSIASAAFGDAKMWPSIAKANPSIDPNRLKTGAVLAIPERSAIIADAQRAAVSNGSSSGNATSTIDSSKQYKVAPGDSLHKIAAKLYGKADMWQKLYDANKSAIGEDPAKLKVGSVLILPEAPASASATR